jgi:hypothetical protein
MKRHVLLLSALLAVTITGCAATTIKTYVAAGAQSLCYDANGHLGYVAVLPETAWRTDQKEPGKRETMALEEIKSAFQGIPCGTISSPGGIRDFSNWSAKPESELMMQFADEGVDTLILLRMEELTPNLYVTFSLPFLWVGANEADFRIRVLALKTGRVLSDMRVKRSTGGPFNVRPAAWSGEELNAALHTIIGNEKQILK